MSTVAKLFNKLLLHRIRLHVDPLLRQNQNGFRTSRSTAEHILRVRRIVEECKVRQDLSCTAVFVDFEKAFDSVAREKLHQVLGAYGIPVKLVTLIMSMYLKTNAQISTSDGLQSQDFEISAGVLQGDTLAPFLFVLVIDYVMRQVERECKHGLQIRRRRSCRHPEVLLSSLEFADDVVLLFRSKGATTNQSGDVEPEVWGCPE